jgi:two-component system nitrogen regulation sensor histidine kinase GlnL
VPLDPKSVLDAVPDGVVVLDDAGRVELSNAEACRILGTSAEASLGQPLERLLGPQHPIATLARRVLETGRGAAWSELGVEQRFGGELMVDAAASPLLDARSQRSGVVLVLSDRTLQLSLRQLVSEQEALEGFGRIAAGVAHEVRNPLGGIRGAAEILASRAADAKTLDAAELIVREVDRIATLVDDLMVFSRGGEDLRLAPVNIHFVLDGVLDLLAMDPLGARVRAERRFDPSIPELLADSDRLTQVFLNLARNALQAMDKGGVLTITTRMSLDHHRVSTGAPHAPTLLVEVKDEGPGIAPAELERLATPFFTTRPGGAGLGLAVARHWVARHGGRLRIESAPGQGTCVRVALPLRRPA